MFETTIDITASPEHVWEVLVDVERWPEWTESMSDLKRLDPGPLAMGSRVRIRQPRVPSTVWTVTSLEPQQAFTWENNAGGVTTVAEHRLRSEGPELVAVTLGVRRSGRLASLVDRLFQGRTERYVRMEAAGLKKRCEADS